MVDLALGPDDGIELVRWIRNDHPNVRVLVLSMQDEALYAERLLRLGVSGYVMKNVAGTGFLGALRKVARGQRHVSSAMGERLLSQVARGRSPAADEDPVSALTRVCIRSQKQSTEMVCTAMSIRDEVGLNSAS